MTDQDLQTAADWLAVNLMEYEWSEHCEYDLEVDNVATLGDWQPHLHTEKGLFQVFGPGGIVERMWGKGWPFFELFRYIASEQPSGFQYWGKFYKDDEHEHYGFGDNPGAAIVLAAKAALGKGK